MFRKPLALLLVLAAVLIFQPGSHAEAQGGGGVCSHSGPNVPITFVNNTSAPVDVFWIDFGCNEVFYYTIAAGASRTQSTFITHPWIIRDNSTHAPLLCFVTGGPGTAVINPGPFVNLCSVVPNLGLVQIDTGNVQPVYDAPGGNAILVGGAALLLPHDADGSGYDTYNVTGIFEVDEETWIGIFLGGMNFGYVRLADVTPLNCIGCAPQTSLSSLLYVE